MTDYIDDFSTLPDFTPTALQPTFSLELSSKLTIFAPGVVQTDRLVCQERRVRSNGRANWPFWPPKRPPGGPRKLPGGRKNHQKRCTVYDFQLFGQTRLRRRQERSKSRSGDAKTGPGAAQAPPTAPQSAPRAVQIGSGGARGPQGGTVTLLEALFAFGPVSAALGDPPGSFSDGLGSLQASKKPTDVTTGRSGRRLNQTTDQLPHTTGSTQLFD